MTRIIIADVSELSENHYNVIYRLLDSERRIRVDGYVFERDKKLAAVSEICLYYLLSMEYKYEEWLLVRGLRNNWKPYFINIPNLHYSISHSGNRCIVGISNQCELGLDIEWLPKYCNLDLLNNIIKLFNEEEISMVECGENLLQRVIVLWTQKEALFKSLGKGTLRQTLNKMLTKEDLRKIDSFILNEYVISIANAPANTSILNANNIGIDNIIEYIQTWKSKSNN